MPGLGDLLPKPPKGDMSLLKKLMESNQLNDLQERVEALERANRPQVKELFSNQPIKTPTPYKPKAKSMWDEPCSIKGVVLIVLTGITLPLLVPMLMRLVEHLTP